MYSDIRASLRKILGDRVNGLNGDKHSSPFLVPVVTCHEDELGRAGNSYTYIEDPYRFPFIDTVEYYTTSACNLGCTYCYLGLLPSKVAEPEKTSLLAIAALGKLFEEDRIGPRLRLLLIGGEPLLAFRALRGLTRGAQDLASKHGVTLSVHLTTNGTILSPEIIEWANECGCSVTISHDGIFQNSNRPTKFRGTTLKAREWIDFLGPSRVGAQATLLPFEYEEQVATFESLIAEGFEDVRINLAAALPSYTSLDVEACIRGILSLYEFCLRAAKFERNLQSAIDGVAGGNLARSHCGAGHSHLVLSHDGQLTACANADIGPVDETEYDVDFDPVCGRCELRYVCNALGGGCRAWRKLVGTVGPDRIDCAAHATRILLASAYCSA